MDQPSYTTGPAEQVDKQPQTGREEGQLTAGKSVGSTVDRLEDALNRIAYVLHRKKILGQDNPATPAPPGVDVAQLISGLDVLITQITQALGDHEPTEGGR